MYSFREYQKNRDWGYNQEQTIVVPVDGNSTYRLFQDEIIQNPNIVHTAGTRHHLGRYTPLVAFDYVGEKYQSRLFDVGQYYLQTLGLRLQKGRLFEIERATDIYEAMVINETFARKMQWDEPLQKQIVYDSTTYTVVGVVEDFHYFSFFDGIEPVMMRLTEADHFNYLAVKIKAGAVTQTAEYLESTWKRLNIRKVLGASLCHVIKLVNKEFIWVMIIAFGMAAPLSFYMLNMLLSSVFQYHIDLGAVPFLLTGICLLLTALLTVSSLIYKVSRINPVTGLWDE